MRKIKLYIAASLNGKIAQADGSVDWLESIPNPEKNDYGYADFYKSVDTTIQGYSTYNQVLSWGIDFPYPDKKNYVLTRKKGLANSADVEFVSENHADFIRQLKEEEGGDIWLIGGGQINSLLLDENLIDEIQVFIMPIVLSGGIEIFEAFPKEKALILIETKTYNSSVVELRYSLG